MKRWSMFKPFFFKSALFFASILVLAGCNFNLSPQGEATPTIQPIVASDTPPPTVTLTLIPTSQVQLQVESPTPTITSAPPTETPTASDTPGPYQYVIKQGDTLITIVQQFHYTELSIGKGGII